MEDKRNMLEKFVKDIKPVFGNSSITIILYGSYARGDYNHHSDIDLMILTNLSDDEIVAIEDQVVDIAFDYELRESVPISINIKNAKHFEYWANTLPYYRNIAKEGIILAG